MNRRQLLTTAFAAALPRLALGAETGWQARLIPGGFDGTAYLAGLHIMLEPGWKTYWRVPGEAGVPPQITVEGENAGPVVIAAPLPKRFSDGSGEAIGYHDEVVFLLRITPKDKAKPLAATVNAFFGVCEQICKPARFSGALALQPGQGETPPFLAGWQARLPQPAAFITKASQKDDTLVLALAQPVDDIFIEGPEELYFRAPRFAPGQAVIAIDGLQPGQALSGISLRCTAAMQAKGLEQTLRVS